MKIAQTITMEPDEIKLACIMYLRESAAGKELQGLRQPDMIQVKYDLAYPREDEAEVRGLQLTLPAISVSILGSDEGVG